MFKELEKINHRPHVFEFYTAADLWTDEHTSQKMLEFHLNAAIDIASRNRNFIEKSVAWITQKFQLDNSKHVIDFGCGPGLYTTRLAQTGAQVTGIDFSPRSIEYARRQACDKNLKIDYINQNYLDFKTENSFDLITMIMCDFCALSPTQRKLLLDIFRKILKPGGSVLLDVYSLAAFAARQEQQTYEQNLLNGFWSAEKYYGFLNTYKYETAHVVLDKYTIVEQAKKRTVYNWLQYFSKETLAQEAGESGLRLSDVLGDVAGSEFDPAGQEFAVILQKAS